MITKTHRALTLVALATVMASVNSFWRSAATTVPLLGLAIGSLFVVFLALIVAALCVRTRRALTRVDACGLAAAALLQFAIFRSAWVGRTVYRVDEGTLTHRAAVAIAHGHSPYGRTFHVPGGFTALFNGHYPDRFGYPPLAPMLGAVVARVFPFVSETAALCFVALIASGVLTFVLLPPVLRPLAVLSVFVASPLAVVAIQGYPIVVTMPFLLLAVWRWPAIGAGGTLGRRGVLQAVALGLACCGQQLVWFLVPFLLVGIWRVRRADLPSRSAAGLVGHVAAIGAVTFLVVNLPFVIASPSAWFTGITDPLRQHAFFSGPGLANISLRVLPSSGALQFYSFATAALYLTLLLALALFPARLGPAALVLPLTIFYLSVRSQAVYYESSLPAVLLSFVVAGPAAFARAVPLRLGTERVATIARRAAPALGAAVTLVLLLVAALTPSPLRATAGPAQIRRAHGQATTYLRVVVQNTADVAISPHFVTDYREKTSLFWTIVQGPRSLRARERGTYLLRSYPGQGGVRITKVWVISDDPQTIRRATIPGHRGRGGTQREPRHT